MITPKQRDVLVELLKETMALGKITVTHEVTGEHGEKRDITVVYKGVEEGDFTTSGEEHGNCDKEGTPIDHDGE